MTDGQDEGTGGSSAVQVSSSWQLRAFGTAMAVSLYIAGASALLASGGSVAPWKIAAAFVAATTVATATTWWLFLIGRMRWVTARNYLLYFNGFAWFLMVLFDAVPDQLGPSGSSVLAAVCGAVYGAPLIAYRMGLLRQTA